jgi:hypothetical protein
VGRPAPRFAATWWSGARKPRTQVLSQTEVPNASLIEPEVMADLVAHCLDDLSSETFPIVTEITDERVAEDQDLVRDPTAPKERYPCRPIADVQAIRMMLSSAVRDNDRDALERLLKLDRQAVERRTDKRFKLLLAVILAAAHHLIIAIDPRTASQLVTTIAAAAHRRRGRRQRVRGTDRLLDAEVELPGTQATENIPWRIDHSAVAAVIGVESLGSFRRCLASGLRRLNSG